MTRNAHSAGLRKVVLARRFSFLRLRQARFQRLIAALRLQVDMVLHSAEDVLHESVELPPVCLPVLRGGTFDVGR